MDKFLEFAKTWGIGIALFLAFAGGVALFFNRRFWPWFVNQMAEARQDRISKDAAFIGSLEKLSESFNTVAKHNVERDAMIQRQYERIESKLDRERR